MKRGTVCLHDASILLYMHTCMHNWLLTFSPPLTIHILASSVSWMRESVVWPPILSPFGLTTVMTLPLHRSCSCTRYVFDCTSFLSTYECVIARAHRAAEGGTYEVTFLHSRDYQLCTDISNITIYLSVINPCVHIYTS